MLSDNEMIRLLQKDLRSSIGGAYENDYRKILFEWYGAKSDSEKQEIKIKYLNVLQDELKFIDATLGGE